MRTDCINNALFTLAWLEWSACHHSGDPTANRGMGVRETFDKSDHIGMSNGCFPFFAIFLDWYLQSSGLRPFGA
jgi:hypothetical protein